jgi:hypothetical protein
MTQVFANGRAVIARSKPGEDGFTVIALYDPEASPHPYATAWHKPGDSFWMRGEYVETFKECVRDFHERSKRVGA